MVPALPQELVDYTIDHLHDDPQALRSCSLTCRSWLPSAQLHIFQYISPVQIIDEPWIHVLESNPHIGKYVKILEIDERCHEFLEDTAAVDKFLSRIAPLLPNVTDLVISNIDFCAFSSSAKMDFRLFEQFRSVRSLSCSYVVFRTFEDFSKFIATFPYLQKLDIQNVLWGLNSEEPSKESSKEQYTLSPHLRTLTLNWIESAAQFVEWCLQPTLEIATLALLGTHPEDIDAVGRLVGILGPSLSQLNVGLEFPVPKESLKALSSNTSLRSLTVQIGPDTFKTGESVGTSVETMLSQVVSTCVEEITFRLPLHEIDNLGLFPLERIDDMVVRRPFENLQRVIFEIAYPDGTVGPFIPDDLEAVRAITGRMKCLHTKGCLVFRGEPAESQTAF